MNPVRRLRFQTKVTQVQLAVLAGTSQPTIASYEAGTKSPTLETLNRLALSLGLEATISFIPPLTREDLRSLAYHQAVVEKMKNDFAHVMAKALRNIKMMSKKHPDAKVLINRWRQWLNLPLEDIIRCCLDLSLVARDMRQVTPFAGVLDANERLQVLKKFRKKGMA